MREQLEQNILDNPNDDAPRLIYADWLEENGDTDRAEFIRVQIALEDEDISTEARQHLAEREAEQLEKHQREWLGSLSPFLLDGKDDVRIDIDEENPNSEFRFRRGFLEELHIDSLGYHMARAMVDAPQLLHVRDFSIKYRTLSHDYGDYAEYLPDEPPLEPVPEDFEVLEILEGCPYLENVSCLTLGDPDDAGPHINCYSYIYNAIDLVAKMPRLRELHLLCKNYDADYLFSLDLPELRVLRMYHLGGHFLDRETQTGYEYPLDMLAENESLKNLEALLFHPHSSEEYESLPGGGYRMFSYLPLEQVQYVLESPNLLSLRHLQLRLSDMGDEGCQAIVESGILERLTILDLRHGALTDKGAKILAECPEFRNLERFDIARNALTQVGIEMLKATGVSIYAGTQLTPEELQEGHYLYEGDSE